MRAMCVHSTFDSFPVGSSYAICGRQGWAALRLTVLLSESFDISLSLTLFGLLS